MTMTSLPSGTAALAPPRARASSSPMYTLMYERIEPMSSRTREAKPGCRRSISAMTSRSVAPEAMSLVCPPVASRRAPGRRTVTGMPSLPERGAEISVPSIRDQHDDTPGFFPRDGDGRRDRGAARDAAEQPLLARKPLGHRDRFVGAHHAVSVGDFLVPDRRPDS